MTVGDFGIRHARWRTWLRVQTPGVFYHRLGFVVPKAVDCGDHEWYQSRDGIDDCYHCKVERPTSGRVEVMDIDPQRDP